METHTMEETMAETGTATGVAMAAIIPEEKLIRVLVIDDNEGFQWSMKRYFESYGYAVDSAWSLEEAKALRAQNEYQIVLADINFDDDDLNKGDRFILQNYKGFKGARIVVVTGKGSNNLSNRVPLEELNIPVWDKSDDDWGNNLNALTEETAQARKQEITGQVNEFISDKLVGPLNDFISDKLGGAGNYVVTGAAATTTIAKAKPERAPWEAAIEGVMVYWLEGLTNQEQPFLSIGRTVLSPRDMIDHVKQKTDMGNKLLGMFVAEVGQSLGIEI